MSEQKNSDRKNISRLKITADYSQILGHLSAHTFTASSVVFFSNPGKRLFFVVVENLREKMTGTKNYILYPKDTSCYNFNVRK